MMSTVDTIAGAEDTSVSDDTGIPEETTTADLATPADSDGADHQVRNRSLKGLLRIALAALVIASTITGTVLGYLKYTSTANDLARMRQTESDRNTAAQRAKDYALKSLTYSFEDPDAFFRSVEEGASPALKDKFVNATPFLKSLMLQAQVSSSGEVVATAVTPQPGDVYEVVVSAYQTARNLQKPEPRVSVMLLQVTVNKVGDTWQVSDIGPKAGSKSPTADQIPVPHPGP